MILISLLPQSTSYSQASSWSDEIKIASSSSNPIFQKSMIDTNDFIHTIWVSENDSEWVLNYCKYDSAQRLFVDYAQLSNSSRPIRVTCLNFMARPFDFTLDLNGYIHIAWSGIDENRTDCIFYIKINDRGQIFYNNEPLVLSLTQITSINVLFFIQIPRSLLRMG